ncbi:MAG: hypothetical protein ACXU8Q_07730 [Caulobacteraceae bacterium]
MSVQAVSPKPGPQAADGVFSPKMLLAPIAAGVFATAAYLVLSAYAPDLRATRGGGAHAISRSAIGYAGIMRLLRLMGEPVVVSESPSARTNYPGLMVLTPEPLRGLGKLEIQHDRLIVLPKWATEPDPAHPGWEANAEAMPEVFVASALPKAIKGVSVVRRRAGASGPVRLVSDFAQWPESGLPAGPIRQFQTMIPGGLKPLIKDDQGGVVLAMAQGANLYVLSDPDLLNTQGMHDPRTARIAATLLLTLKTDDQPIAFDVSATEAGGQKSLLRLAIEPPFLASTLCLVVVAALVGVQAWFRFGPAVRAPRAVALGKTALVETGAGMVRLARREPQMARRYVQLCRHRAAAALGAAHLEGEALDAFLDRWAERVGAQERISVLTAEALLVKDIVGLTALAQRARRWRLEVTRGS